MLDSKELDFDRNKVFFFMEIVHSMWIISMTKLVWRIRNEEIHSLGNESRVRLKIITISIPFAI